MSDGWTDSLDRPWRYKKPIETLSRKIEKPIEEDPEQPFEKISKSLYKTYDEKSFYNALYDFFEEKYSKFTLRNMLKNPPSMYNKIFIVHYNEKTPNEFSLEYIKEYDS